MSEFSSHDFAPNEGPKQRLLKRLRLLLLIVVVIVGVLGGYRIYQLTLAESNYVVLVEPEFDVYGGETGTLYDTPILLQNLDYELFLGRSGVLLLELPATEDDRIGKLSVSGAEIRQEVEAGRVRGRLRWPGADPERLTIDLGLAMVEEDTIRHELTLRMTEEFLDGRISTTVGVHNQNNDPVDGLERADRLTPVGDRAGVYEVTATVDDLLWRFSQGDSDYSLQATQQESGVSWQLDIPLAWFLTRGESSRVITVEERLVAPSLVPVAERLAPMRVIGGRDGWDGRLTVHGVDLDLVTRAYLVRGDRRIAMNTMFSDTDRLVLSVDPSTVAAGVYGVELETDRGDEVFPVPQRLRVTAGLWWIAPAEGTHVVQGTTISLAWGNSLGEEQALVEGGRERHGDRWSRLAQASGRRGEAGWSTEGVESGTWVLRLSLPGRAEISPKFRTIELDPLPTLPVLIRFRKGGAPYGRIKELWIDDVEMEIGSDRMNTRLDLLPGEHRWTAYEALRTYTGYLFVESEDQIIDLELNE